MRLIATWNDPEGEQMADFNQPPVSVRWADGTPATMADYSRIDPLSQSDADVYEDRGRRIVEFGYDVHEVVAAGE